MPITKPKSIPECEKMEETCCSEIDMKNLKEKWTEKYSKYLDYHIQYFRYYIIQIMENHNLIKEAAEEVKEKS